jgi:hypothetical protein
MFTELHINEKLYGARFMTADTTGCELHYTVVAAW